MFKKWLVLSVCIGFVTACVNVPEGIKAVEGFEIEPYLGTWYEIARLDHSFERGLDQVTANYSLREDGGVRVLNQGYSSQSNEWEDAEGRAYFVEDENTAFLKVSFFGPFFGSYIIFELEDNYQYAFVSGPDLSYLWFLSRTKQVDESQKNRFISVTEELGFNTENLIWVDQVKNN